MTSTDKDPGREQLVLILYNNGDSTDEHFDHQD